MRRIKFIVIHHNGVAGRDISNIRRTHLAKGWSDVGYHYVIKENGVCQRGRPEAKSGAHAQGLNANSISVCLIGNGNKKEFTPDQTDALYYKLLELTEAYPDSQIIGHREVNPYVKKEYHTKKSCPGKLLDLDEVRGWVAAA